MRNVSDRSRPRLRGSGWLLYPLLATALFFAGCQGEEGHIRPHGMVIREGARVVVHARGTSVDGGISVPRGGETPRLSVRFLDRNGTEIEPGQWFFLEVVAADPGMMEWRPEAPGAFEGRFAGRESGSTTLLVRWMHGTPGDEHKDRDWPVPLTVLP